MELHSAPSFRLDGKRALVSGAGRGIGLAAASALADAGAHVTLAARTAKEIEEAAAAIRARGHEADALLLDVSDLAAMQRAIAAARPFNILVNNAGTNRPKPLLEVTIEDFDAIMGLNVRAAYFVAQAVARRLIDARQSGSIINISSQMGHVGAARRTVYCASKHAMEGFTKAMAIELAPHDIRVNTIGPTFIETPLTKPFFENEAFRREVLSKIKLGRIGQMDELTGAIVFLASDASRLMTGSALGGDGGWAAEELPRRLPLPDRGVHLRQHLFGDQDHVAAAKLAVLPVLAGKQERAEVADLFAECEDLIGNAIGRAPEHQLLAHRIERDVVVVLLRIGLERDRATAALQLGEELAVVVTIRPIRIGGVALRGRIIVGNEDRFRDAPVCRVGGAPDALTALDIFRPVRLDPLRHQKIRRDRIPAARRRLSYPLGEGRNGGDDDRRMRQLQGSRQIALTEIGHEMFLEHHVPVFALDAIGRIALPDLQHLVDAFQKHRVAIGIEIAERLGVRHQAARRDAKDEAAIQHMIEHRDVRRDCSRMIVRHVDGAGAEFDALRRLDQRANKHHARRDVLGAVGVMLADIAFDVAELVGEDERLAILAQRNAPVLLDRMDRHGEEAEVHGAFLSVVMRGLDPRIHDFLAHCKTWMAGTSPAMTNSFSHHTTSHHSPLRSAESNTA